MARALQAPPAVGLIATATVAFFYPLNFFSLLGMETGAQALLYSLITLVFIQNHRQQQASILPWILIALATFVRLDSYVFALASLIAIFVISPTHLRRRHVRNGILTIVITLALQTAIRFAYYHQWLPNTYYLKMTGYPMYARIVRGLYVTARTATNIFWPLFILLPFVYIWFTRHRATAIAYMRTHLPQSPWLLIIIPVLAQFAYSAYVGGDVWENEIYANRFIVIIAPHIFLLVAIVIHEVLQHIAQSVPLLKTHSPARHPIITTLVLAPLLILQSNHHGSYEWAWKQATLQLPPKDTNWAKDGIRYALTFQAILPPDYTIVSERAGTVPYFMPHHTFLDPLGKTDIPIAHQPSRIQPEFFTDSITSFTPGHNKWDCQHTFTEQKPDAVIIPTNIIFNHCRRELKLQYTSLKLRQAEYSVFLRNSPATPQLLTSIAATYKSLD